MKYAQLGFCQDFLWQHLVQQFGQLGLGIAPVHRAECEAFLSIPADQDCWSDMGMWF